MTSYLFRKAEQKDLKSIILLLLDDDLGKEREEFSGKITPSYQKAFDQISLDPNQFLMVVEYQGAIVATCHLTLIPSLTFQGGLRMSIEAVRVMQSHRSQGIGGWMMKQAISLAQEKGCKIVQLTTNKERKAASKFYKGLGFQSTHEGMKLLL